MKLMKPWICVVSTTLSLVPGIAGPACAQEHAGGPQPSIASEQPADAVSDAATNEQATPGYVSRQSRAGAIWQDTIYAAEPCGGPPLGQTSRVFEGVGHCLHRYDRFWAGYCDEIKFPAIAVLRAQCLTNPWQTACRPEPTCAPLGTTSCACVEAPIEIEPVVTSPSPDAEVEEMPPAPETPVSHEADPVTLRDTAAVHR